MRRSIPVIVLAGYLGAGKTTLLNHVLSRPDSRIGVIINDFGDINLDAGLVRGQVDEPASIAGGCLCCLPDAGGLPDALAKLAKPRLGLDAIIVEASGIADPVALARLIRADRTPGIRPGGIVDLVDVAEYFDTIDHDAEPPVRFVAASMVVLNKIDRLADHERETVPARITERIRARNPDAHVVRTSHGRIDPALLLDVGSSTDGQQELPWRAPGHVHDHDHDHARSVTVRVAAICDPDRIVGLLEDPPEGAYRIKGELAVATGKAHRRYRLNIVGRSVHLAAVPVAATGGQAEDDPASTVVAIGMDLDVAEVRQRLQDALAPVDPGPSVQVPAAAQVRAAFDRLDRYRRLSG